MQINISQNKTHFKRHFLAMCSTDCMWNFPHFSLIRNWYSPLSPLVFLVISCFPQPPVQLMESVQQSDCYKALGFVLFAGFEKSHPSEQGFCSFCVGDDECVRTKWRELLIFEDLMLFQIVELSYVFFSWLKENALIS